MTANDEIIKMTEIIKGAVPVEKIYLFGSYAYGTPHTGSDYDFYVVLPNDTIKPIDAIKTIYRALSQMKKRNSVDVLALSSERFNDRSRLLTLEKKVMDEGMLLYG